MTESEQRPEWGNPALLPLGSVWTVTRGNDTRHLESKDTYYHSIAC